MINPMQLSGKQIIVTGASSGLGRQVCITLSQLGAKVILVARNEKKLQQTLSLMDHREHNVFVFDVNQVDEIEGFVKDIVEKCGKIDGFVHCAGIGTVKPLSQTKYSFMQEMMNIHVFSFIEFVRIISKKRYSNEGGSIIAISSAGTKHSDKGKTAYATTKGALDSAVLPLAIELGSSRKMRVNTINPGWIKTDMYYGFIQEFGQERMDEIENEHILGAAEPVDIANIIAFLLSDAANKITGQNIFADSGWTIW